VFATSIYFHFSPLFAGKAGGYQSGFPYGIQPKGDSYPCLQILDKDRICKHSSLLWYGKNYGHKKYYCAGSWETIFTTPHFLRNLRVGPMHYSVTFTLGLKGLPGSIFGPIHKLQRK
jgi:hypothetical protein